MKLKRLFAVLALATVGGLASAIGIEKSAEKPVEPAEAYTTDSTITIYFTRPSDWGDNGIRIHTWDEGGAGTTWESAHLMTWVWNNAYGQGVFVWHPSDSEKLYSNIKFHNDNHGMESTTLDAPTSSTQYYYDNGWQATAAPTERIYLYDYDNRFNGHVNLHAWRDGASSFTTPWPGVQMTAAPLAGNGLVYYADVLNIYNRVIFNWNGDENKTDTISGSNNDYCYVLANEATVLSGKNTWWDNINYVYAHNWSQNYMKMRSISTDDNSEGTACLTTYGPAKTAYQAFVNDTSGVGSEVLTQITNNFAAAKTRLAAWASANSEVFNSSNNSFAPKQNSAIITGSESTSIAAMPIIIVMTLTVGSVAGIFFLRKKRKI